jgi:hypothetical protein
MLVIAEKSGQLGNRLLVFAHCITIAEQEGCTVVNLAFDEYAPWFPATRDDLFCRYPPRRTAVRSTAIRHALYVSVRGLVAFAWLLGLRRTPWWRLERIGWGEKRDLASPDLVEAMRTKILLLQGWLFRNGDAFRRHADVIRRVLTPSVEIQARAEEAVDAVRARGEVVIGVHIRRGDYRSHLGGRFFFGLDAYGEVMSKARRLFPHQTVSFLVASEEPIDGSAFRGFEVGSGPGDACGDLHALAGCDYLLGPPSSFTLWASFVGDVPLYPIVDPSAEVDPASFRVAPDLADPELSDLYGLDV